MSSAKIETVAVELAINAAVDALANDANIAWIRKSCLIQRAYFLGLFKGLAAISGEGDIGNLPLHWLTMVDFSGSADDTFPSTQLGQDFAALGKGLRLLETGSDMDRPSFETVLRDIDLLDRGWRTCLGRARTLLSETQSAASGFRPPIDDDLPDRKRAGDELGQVHDSLSRLEALVRYMALLETHHEMSKRLEGA